MANVCAQAVRRRFGRSSSSWPSRTALASDRKFVDSDDAKEKDEPQKFLPDYDKLVKGKDADWVYFPDGSLSKYKTASVEEFDHNGHGPESREAARDGKDYMEQWLEKQGFKVVKSGGDITDRRQRLQRLGAERGGAGLGRLGGQPGSGPGAADQEQQGRRGRRAAAEGQGIDHPRRGRERPRGLAKSIVEGK